MIIESPAEKSGFLFGVAPTGDELLGRDCEGTLEQMGEARMMAGSRKMGQTAIERIVWHGD